MSDEKDPFGGDTGLLTDYEGVVLDAWFNTDPQAKFNKDQVFLFLRLATDNPENEVHEERYGCGPDWQTFDGGVTVEHPKGEGKRFNENTQVQRFVSAAIACDGAAEVLRPRGTPRNAKIWIGTKWYFEAETREGTLDDGSKYKSTKNFPTKFLGVGDVADGESAGTVLDDSKGGSSGAWDAKLTDAQRAKVVLTAKTAKDYADWTEKVMEIDGILAHDDFVSRLGDEDFYNSLKEQ